uniref:Uncharacterized protein n=1 Tax=Knipowitschia caucasica TaxID=637954 RepID=A0AAV2MNI7_KNICA
MDLWNMWSAFFWRSQQSPSTASVWAAVSGGGHGSRKSALASGHDIVAKQRHLCGAWTWSRFCIWRTWIRDTAGLDKYSQIFCRVAMMGLLPQYLADYLVPRRAGAHNLRSQSVLMPAVPKVLNRHALATFSSRSRPALVPLLSRSCLAIAPV